MSLLKSRLLKPRFPLSALFWLTLAVACIFLGRASTRWNGSDLKVQNLTFCEEIRGYGQIKPVTSSYFTSGQHATLYVDVENFSQKSLGDTFETAIAGEYRIFDSKYKEVFAGQLPVDRQQSINRKRDHYAGYRIMMPSLPSGEYRFQLVLRDSNAGRMGRATVPFQLASTQE